MDVRGVGAGPAPVDPGGGMRIVGAPKSPALASPGADTVAGLLRELSETEMVRVLEWIERPPLPETGARVEEIVRLVAEGKITLALERLAELAPLDPQRAEALPAEPALASMRTQAESLLLRLTAAARLEAGSRLAHAEQTLPPENRPEAMLQLANRLLEAGGYANIMTAAQVAQMLIDGYRPVETPAAPRARPRRTPWESTRQAWRRAPLLVLLLGWLVFGLAGCLLLLLLASSLAAGAFELWGLGFLILVAFGFYMRIRNIRF